ncbi:MAG: hypothetical protein LBC97_02030 [Bifidobacteriaceae bacterium]|nr:hypothetical protein [Bifidobacteriaceae bacterium]
MIGSVLSSGRPCGSGVLGRGGGTASAGLFLHGDLTGSIPGGGDDVLRV